MNTHELYDLVVIGSGAAGLGAGLYAGRYRMKTLVVGGSFGGATATAGTIHNYPGAPEADGYELMKLMKGQCKDLGVLIETGWVTSLMRDGSCFKIIVGEGEKAKEIGSKTIIFAMGTERRKLGVPGEEAFAAKGVHYCITCDGPLYHDKTIAIVGGGDGSVKGVNLAAEYAKKIYLIARGPQLRAEPINLEHMQALGDKVEVLYETQVKEILGDGVLNAIKLDKEVNGSTTVSIDGLFIEIGSKPQTKLPEDLGVALDERSYIVTDNMMSTNIPGVYAAGDTTNFFGPFKQTITGAATGSVAATSAYNFYKQHGNLCEMHWVPVMLEGAGIHA
ncbi:MAG: FAD-dependent oxidoreductase [bacterium]|nr:FAD-dependent oxidoreductase [bacterium]